RPLRRCVPDRSRLLAHSRAGRRADPGRARARSSGVAHSVSLARRAHRAALPWLCRSELTAERPVLECGEQLVVGLESAGDAVALGANGGDLRGELLLFTQGREWNF